VKLYWIESEGRYVHRLSDIPKGEPVDQREIPTDQPGLMAHLNGIAKRALEERRSLMQTIESFKNDGPDTPYLDPVREQTPPEPLPEPEMIPSGFIDPDPPMCATSILSRIDNPKIPVDDVVETIGTSKGYALRRYAGAVALRFEELSKK